MLLLGLFWALLLFGNMLGGVIVLVDLLVLARNWRPLLLVVAGIYLVLGLILLLRLYMRFFHLVDVAHLSLHQPFLLLL